jgi:hypothetical protein
LGAAGDRHADTYAKVIRIRSIPPIYTKFLQYDLFCPNRGGVQKKLFTRGGAFGGFREVGSIQGRSLGVGSIPCRFNSAAGSILPKIKKFSSIFFNGKIPPATFLRGIFYFTEK